MFWYATSALFIIWTVYLAIKYVLKPYLRMLKYNTNQGAAWIAFYPILGAFRHTQQSFQLTGDEHYLSKRIFQANPQARFFLLNAFDKCLLLLVDPLLLQQFFQKQQFYMKQESFIENKIRYFNRGAVLKEDDEKSRTYKLISSIFHQSFFNKFIQKVKDTVDYEVVKIRGHERYTFQAKQLSIIITGDIILKTFFGSSFNQKANGEPTSIWFNQLLKDIEAQQRSMRFFLFGDKILTAGLFPQDKKINNRMGLFKGIVRSAIERALNTKQHQEGSVLQAFFIKSTIFQKGGYTIEEAIEDFIGFFIAGTDTSAKLISMCFYYLSLYPNHQQTLRKEIQQSGVLSNLDFRSISSMKFIQAIVKQTFRHYNYMVTSVPKICTKEHSLCEISIKQGDIIMPGWAHSMYNKKYFPHPETFDPQRWLKPDQRQLTCVFTPYGIGSRSCLGQNFALLQAKIVLIKMIGQFKMKFRTGVSNYIKINTAYEHGDPITIDLQDV